MNKFTERNIQEVLGKYWFKKGHKISCYNFSGCGHSETDFISVTSANFIYSFEIKISKSDFNNDFKNKKIKHKSLKDAKKLKSTSGIPNYFYFVVPENLIDLKSVPSYAGLIYINDQEDIEIKRKAPRLHAKKASTPFFKKMLIMYVERNIFGCSYLAFKNKQAKKAYEEKKLKILNNKKNNIL